MSKIKKLLKKVGKAALIGGGAYLAAKGLGGKKTDSGLSAGKKFLASGAAGSASLAKQDRMAKAIKAMTSNKAYNDDTMPATGNMYGDGNPKNRNVSYALKSGGRAGYKSGGKSKPKSIGKALRGGGKVMR